MRLDQIYDLLVDMAVYDHRIIGDPDAEGGDPDAEAWYGQVGQYGYEDCLAAVRAYYRRHSPGDKRISPADVVVAVESTREGRRTAEAVTARPPEGIADDPKAYIEWVKQAEQAIGDGQQPPAALPAGRTVRAEVER